MKKAFGQTLIILLFICMLVFSAIYIIQTRSAVTASVGQDGAAVGQTGQTELPEDTRVSLGMAFTRGAYSLTAGEKLRLSLNYSDGSEVAPQDVQWSSSDISVALVDTKGSVTAVGYGVARIQAMQGEYSAQVTVSVSGDIISETEQAIALLAEQAGTGMNYIDACAVYEQLGRCQSINGADNLYNLMGEILAYVSDDGNADELYSAIEASGLSEEVCLLAAAGCYAKGETLRSDAVISFVGDVTLARLNESSAASTFPAVYKSSDSLTYPFDRTRTVFTCDTLSVVNFEGVLTESKKHRDKEFFFRGDAAYAAILPLSGIEAATLENNHSHDYLDAGFADTVENLSAAGVATFYEGSPYSATFATAVGGVKITMLDSMWANSTKMPDSQLDTLLSEIRRCNATGDSIVVVNLHWGGELMKVPEQWQIDAAHAMADAGAELIVGHHPHILQGVELYNGCYIAYSLGNFAFGGNKATQNPQTVILRAQIGSSDGSPVVTGVSFMPCLTTSTGTTKNNYQPTLCFGSTASGVINTLLSRSASLQYGISRRDISWPEI